ncbi:CoA transferase [Solimonas sp. K1W22B-7]|uniref:CaiB/BaiF CoA transferase family protein n=1 Tax=Solimonas sp. K1W22B-7 TaxID=2303331 RepID=UPI000E32F2EF|nr:CoA transferase [Solimonas sp. K1W22B-7]AXQ30655.1 CoA transferase [Solimonas sp. K1W22B-7]
MSSTGTAFAHGPLTGLRVIELGTLIAGPFCGQLMADFGAEVIKVEPPGSGDPMRQWGKRTEDGKPLWWPVIARNKKSVTLDLRQAEGQAMLRRLVEQADILIENFRPGTLEKWNLGWDALSAANPKLIMVRVSGYGQDGPYAEQPSFGVIGEAMGGLRYIVGDPSAPPSRVGISIGDTLAATFGCLGALAALNVRHATGRGQMVDSALYEAVLNVMESLIPEYDKTGFIRERNGAILPGIAPSNVYATADGMVLIGANQDGVFARLCKAMGEEAMGTCPEYGSHDARGQRQAELDERIERWTRARPTKEVLALMREHGVPAGLIYRAPDMLADPHFQARQAVVSVAHPDFGELRMQNVAPKLSETPGRIRQPSPALGQHNGEIYGGLLGLDAAALEGLRQQGIV